MVPGKSIEVRELTFGKTRDFCSSFHATEGCSPPRPSSDQLESSEAKGGSCGQVRVDERCDLRTSGNLLPRSGDTDDGRDSPSLMASLEGGTHNVDLTHPASASGKYQMNTGPDVSGGIKSEIQSSISDLDKVILDAFASRELSWVHEVRRTELPSPSFFPRVCINSDDTRGPHEGRSTDNAEANAATTEDSNSRILDPLLFDDSTPGGGNTTSKEANLLQRSSGVNSDDGYIGDNCVLRERRGSHLQMQRLMTPTGCA
jgi:hypothetical protein